MYYDKTKTLIWYRFVHQVKIIYTVFSIVFNINNNINDKFLIETDRAFVVLALPFIRSQIQIPLKNTAFRRKNSTAII